MVSDAGEENVMVEAAGSACTCKAKGGGTGKIKGAVLGGKQWRKRKKKRKEGRKRKRGKEKGRYTYMNK